MSRPPLLPPGLGARLWLDRGVAIVAVLVIAATSATVGAVARSLDRLAEVSVRQVVAEAAPQVVGVTASMLAVDALADAEAVDALRTRGPMIGADLPAPLDVVVSSPATVVDTVRFLLLPLDEDGPSLDLTSFLTVRIQDAGDALAVAEGRRPVASTERVAVAGEGGPVALHEVALTPTTMERLGLELGDRVVARPDTTDPLARRVGLLGVAPIVVEVVGSLQLTDSDDPVWWGDPRLHRPAQIDTGSTTTYFAFGWTPADAGPLPGAGALPAQVDWRFGVGPEAVAEAGPGATLTAARRLVATTAGLTPDVDQVVPGTGLGEVLGAEQDRRGVAVNVLRLGMVAITAVGLAVVVLLAMQLGERRRERTALTLGRGASRFQVLAAAVVESAGLAVVGSVVGFGAALVAVAGGTVASHAAVSALVAGASAAALAGATSARHRSLHELLQRHPRTGGIGARSLVLDGAVLVVTVAGVVALRRRGVTGAVADPLVIAVPVLVGLTVGLVLRRLYRVPLRALAAAARRGAGLALTVGLARGARQGTSGPLVTVMVLATAVALFAGALAVTVTEGQELAAWEEVGAPLRVETASGAALSPIEDVVPSGTTVVNAWQDAVAVNSGPDTFGRADVVAADLEVLETMLRDTPAPLALPARTFADDGRGGGGGPTPVLPAVASVAWFNGNPLAINDQVDVFVGTGQVTYQVVAFRRRLLGLDEDEGGPFLLIPREATEQVLGRPLPTTLQLVGDDAAAAAVRRTVADAAVVTTRRERARELAANPLPRGLVVGFGSIAVTAVAFSLLALVVWQALTAGQRTRDLAVLSALGTPRRTRLLAALAEVLPAALVGVVAGAVTGGLIGEVLDGVVRLAPFTGTASVDELVADGATSRWGTLAVLVTVVLLAVVGTWRGDRAQATTLLRRE